MKTALVFFRPSNACFDGEYYGKVISVFVSGGISVDEVSVISSSDEGELSRRIDEIKNVFDNLIVVDGEKCEFDLKYVIAERMETVFVDNDNAKPFVEDACGKKGTPYDGKYAALPADATLIPNAHGAYQGYLMDADEFTFAVLPENFSELKIMCEAYLLPYLKNKFHVEGSSLVLKYFGSSERAERVLSEATEKRVGVSYAVSCKYGDVTINVTFAPTVSEADKTAFNREVLGALKEDVYAEFSTTLGERLFDVLKLKKLKLAVAESFTGGGVANAIVKFPGASEFLTEGIVAYSNESKVKRLGVSERSVKDHGAVSSTVAYEMAAGLLKSGRCDVAIATTGIAGPTSDGTDKPIGLGFIAVGMKDGVHTYRYNFSGSREEIMETAKNTALFLTIKKLKNV